MLSYAVDSKRQGMLATGIVEPVAEWTEDADGKRRRIDARARDERTGLPLWGVEVTYRVASWGRQSTETAKVTVGAKEMPVRDILGHQDRRVTTFYARPHDDALDQAAETLKGT